MSETKQKPPYPLRMPEDMRESLQESARQKGRSLNAEIIERLHRSLLVDSGGDVEDQAEAAILELDEALEKYLFIRKLQGANDAKGQS